MSLDSCVLTQEARYKYKSVQMVGYADDINLMGRSLREKRKLLRIWTEKGRKLVLKQINESHTKFLIQARKEDK
jgi:hypothetical protein